jgi:hypothetical protein
MSALLLNLHRAEHVYLYRAPVDIPGAQALLRKYLLRIRELHRHPEWYNALTSNCFTNMVDLLRNTLLRRWWPDVTLAMIMNGKAAQVRVQSVYSQDAAG